MNTNGRAGSDRDIERFARVLRRYAADHPGAKVDVYRLNPACIRVRVIDPGFRGVSEDAREALVWERLKELPDDTLGQISLLLLFTPQEAQRSGANHEFDHPLPTSPPSVESR